jgi:hypothetical protein
MSTSFDEDNIPLGILYSLKHHKKNNSPKTFIDLSKLTLKKQQLKLWEEHWNNKIAKHKKLKNRHRVVIYGEII